MSLADSRLVPLVRIEDKIRADIIIELLEEQGITATWRVPQTPPLDGLEMSWLGEHYGEILVLDVNLKKAKEIIGEIKD